MQNKLLTYGIIIIAFFQSCALKKAQDNFSKDGYELVWSDEFSKLGQPDPANWTYEKGFVRNQELQYYQSENAYCKNGMLIIEARKEQMPNPGFKNDTKDWRKQRKFAEYTSACLITRGLKSWQYGRFEMRAKIDIADGLWPAFWTLGTNGNWPANGEIDIMEYYKGTLLANIASAGRDGRPKWFSKTRPVIDLGGKKWSASFHDWRMDWDSKSISLFVDDVLLNKTLLSELDNENRNGIHPFKQEHYILLDLAIGGMHGGDPHKTKFPKQFIVDYVRVYQKTN